MSQDPTYLAFVIKYMKSVNYSKLGLRRRNVQRPKPSQIFLSTSLLQTPVPYQPPISFSSSFLNSCHRLPHLQSPDAYVPSSLPFPYSFFPFFRSHLYSIQLKQAPSTHCPSGAVRDFLSLSLLSILTPDNTELRDCMKSSLAFSCPKHTESSEN